MKENNGFQGIGMSPRPRWMHQDIIVSACYQLYGELSRQGYIVRVDSSITDNWNDIAPDIVVFDQENYPLMIMEVTRHRELRKNLNKCTAVLERFPEAECFVYDYERQELLMFNLESCTWVSSFNYELYSQYLEKPMLDYFE